MPISRDTAPTRGKTFYAKIDPPRFAVPGRPCFFSPKTIGLLYHKIRRWKYREICTKQLWYCRLTNGSSTFQFWCGGRSVGLRAKTLDNRWATKKISVYSLAYARITACRWIRGNLPHGRKLSVQKFTVLVRFAVPEQSGFLRKRLDLLCAKSVNANFAKIALSGPLT